MAAIVVAIINLKGGVGKSTIAMVLGEFLSFRHGKRVLLIDMDAQGNLSYLMVSEAQITRQENQERTTYHLLKKALHGGSVDIRQFITQPPLVVSNIARNSAASYPGTLHIIVIVVSTPSVAELDEELLALWEKGAAMPTSLRSSLSEALVPAREDYDYVIIDCPPGLSLFSSTALLACDHYVAPIIPEPLSLQGVDLVQRRVTELNQRVHGKAQFQGVILNIVKHYRKTHQTTPAMLYGSGAAKYKPFRYWLPDNERLRWLGEFDPDSRGTWAGGVGNKFSGLHHKYSLSYHLTNPGVGTLSLKAVEGDQYRLEERMGRLVEEFQQRCV